MNENYIMLNGKRIDLTAEQIETLVGKKKKDPFERRRKEIHITALIITWRLTLLLNVTAKRTIWHLLSEITAPIKN